MKSTRFLTPARAEFLAEIAYYNTLRLDLGAQFATAVEEAVARAVAFPKSGSRWWRERAASIPKASLFPSSIGQNPGSLSSSPLPIKRGAVAIGKDGDEAVTMKQ